MWHHKEPYVRRADFPSWSSIGWNDHATWIYGKDMYLDTPRVGIRNVLIRREGKLTPLSSFSSRELRESNLAPPFIEFLTEAADLQVVDRTWTLDPREEPGRVISKDVVLNICDQWRARVQPFWDVAPTDQSQDNHLKAVLFLDDNATAIAQRIPHNCVLLLTRCDSYFERVGLFWLRSKDWVTFRNEVTIEDNEGHLLSNSDPRLTGDDIQRHYQGKPVVETDLQPRACALSVNPAT